jgi:2-keto-4-pentenoate hydratase/2-oxohepta-3-ene-1,7-dioic acid hydratase in catechol pathway
MRLVTFRMGADERLGFQLDAGILDPGLVADHAGDPVYSSTLEFIRAGSDAQRAAGRLIDRAPADAMIPLAEVMLTAPMRPSTILCSGSNYRDHNEEKANTAISGTEPEFFIKTADSVVGPGEDIVYDPALTRKLDCETELAVVIGKPGRHIPVESALDHVFGYTIVNDVTARDRQVRRSPDGSVWYDLGLGKSFDTSAPLGPCIVTADEIPDPQNLQLKTLINGELRQSSTTAQMIWTCAELIHFFSASFTLRPGMVIITGTPAGTAWSMDPELGGKGRTPQGLVPAGRYCLPGDRIESVIEGIGVLPNQVVHL